MKRNIIRLFVNLRETRLYILIAAVIFIAGIFLGIEFKAFHRFLEGQIESLVEVAEQLNSMENSSFWIFLFIFLNNTIKSIAIIYLGIFFGVLPVLFLLVNGMVLGYLYILLQSENISVWQLVIGILPHGIIEIPVIIIACAYGMRMGVISLRKLFQVGYSRDEQRPTEFKPLLKEILPLLLFIMVTLFAAAVIEVTITPWLMAF